MKDILVGSTRVLSREDLSSVVLDTIRYTSNLNQEGLPICINEPFFDRCIVYNLKAVQTVDEVIRLLKSASVVQ